MARKVHGLEAALVDKREMTIGALDAADPRLFDVAVAGPTAVLVSKIHKIRERLAEHKQRRLDDKDALDVFRLLQAIPTAEFARAFVVLLENDVAKQVSRDALGALQELFSTARSPGTQMVVRAAGPLAPREEVAESCAILATDLLKAIV